MSGFGAGFGTPGGPGPAGPTGATGSAGSNGATGAPGPSGSGLITFCFSCNTDGTSATPNYVPSGSSANAGLQAGFYGFVAPVACTVVSIDFAAQVVGSGAGSHRYTIWNGATVPGSSGVYADFPALSLKANVACALSLAAGEFVGLKCEKTGVVGLGHSVVTATIRATVP